MVLPNADTLINGPAFFVYRRAGHLVTEVGDPATTIPILAGLWNNHLTRAEALVALGQTEAVPVWGNAGEMLASWGAGNRPGEHRGGSS